MKNYIEEFKLLTENELSTPTEGGIERKLTLMRLMKIKNKKHWNCKQIDEIASSLGIGQHWGNYLLHTGYAKLDNRNRIIIDHYDLSKDDIIYVCQYANYLINKNINKNNHKIDDENIFDFSENEIVTEDEDEIINSKKTTEYVTDIFKARQRILELENILLQERLQHKQELSKLLGMIK